VFIITIATQMLTLTVKMQSRDIALSLAQAKIEEMRSNLIVPEYVEDEPKPGFIRTVTSTYLFEDGEPIKFLRYVKVTVRTPTILGGRIVSIETNIQTYRPQISFTFPKTAEAYIRAVSTILQGTIRDDGYDILKNQIFYRTRNGATGSWESWTQLTNLYTDDKRQSLVTTNTLYMGTTYYFTIDFSATGDGNVKEIQVQATNTASISNLQPNTPRGGTSYIRLISDNTPPTATVSLKPTGSITTGSAPTFDVFPSDPGGIGVSSGILNAYSVITKTTSTGTYYWKDSETEKGWVSSIYYCSMTLTPPGYYTYSFPSSTPSIFLYEPGTIYTFKAVVLDNVIGKYQEYLFAIPTQGTPAGSYPSLIWPDVNANYCATPPTSLTMYPMPTVTTSGAVPYNPSKVWLYGIGYPNGLSSRVWFEWGETESYGFTTTPATITGAGPVPFSYYLETVSPSTTYHFRACISNDWGVFYGEDAVFTMPPPTP
jgi:hypothetical protein